MSWSIEKTSSNQKYLLELKVVTEADIAGILMFYSANDQGKTEDASFPGEFRKGTGTMYKTGAATATGGEYPYVHLGSVDYLFPGRVVEKVQDENASDYEGIGLKDRSSEGSFLATASHQV